MVQIPILSGIYTAPVSPDVRVSYPLNLVPVPTGNGVSAGYLRPAEGIVGVGEGPGVGRGGVEWQGVLYRVMGTKLVRIDALGNVTIIDIDGEAGGGDVGEGGPVRFAYSFDLLAIASGGRLYYLNKSGSLLQVTDPDVGYVVDVVWIDGYFMVTDGEFLAVSDLDNPFSFNPLKYGSSESDPDPVVAVLRLRNEVVAVNRNSMEWFDNVGGEGFPFQRIDGAKITKGAVGTFAACVYLETIAFVGSGYNEAPGVYLGVNASANKISTLEIDRILSTLTEAELASIVVETRNADGRNDLYIHLPSCTLVYDATASKAFGEQAWRILSSTLTGSGAYRARYFVWCYDRWNSCDPYSYQIARLDSLVSSCYGEPVSWSFGTSIIYNEGRGAVLSELELVALPGRVALGKDPRISTSHSVDGMTWSQPRAILAGKIGERTKRLTWFRCGSMANMRMQRFQGTSDAHISFLRLEAQIEGTAY